MNKSSIKLYHYLINRLYINLYYGYNNVNQNMIQSKPENCKKCKKNKKLILSHSFSKGWIDKSKLEQNLYTLSFDIYEFKTKPIVFYLSKNKNKKTPPKQPGYHNNFYLRIVEYIDLNNCNFYKNSLTNLTEFYDFYVFSGYKLICDSCDKEYDTIDKIKDFNKLNNNEIQLIVERFCDFFIYRSDNFKYMLTASIYANQENLNDLNKRINYIEKKIFNSLKLLKKELEYNIQNCNKPYLHSCFKEYFYLHNMDKSKQEKRFNNNKFIISLSTKIIKIIDYIIFNQNDAKNIINSNHQNFRNKFMGLKRDTIQKYNKLLKEQNLYPDEHLLMKSETNYKILYKKEILTNIDLFGFSYFNTASISEKIFNEKDVNHIGFCFLTPLDANNKRFFYVFGDDKTEYILKELLNKINNKFNQFNNLEEIFYFSVFIFDCSHNLSIYSHSEKQLKKILKLSSILNKSLNQNCITKYLNLFKQKIIL